MWLAYSQLFSFGYTWGCVGDFPHVGMWEPFGHGAVVWGSAVRPVVCRLSEQPLPQGRDNLPSFADLC